jgi:hypothetical protein
MVGQGRPSRIVELAPPNRDSATSRCRRAQRVTGGLLRRCKFAAPAIFLALSLVGVSGAQQNVQVRIAWGGPDRPRQWHGAISVDRGRLDLLRPLGREADEPGSMWLDENRLQVRQRSAKSYDGADVEIVGPQETLLRIELGDSEPGSGPPSVTEVSVADLLKNPVSKDLDKFGNRLLVRRAPGDMLRVDFKRDHLVFSPGEAFSFDLTPRHLPVGAGMSVQLRARLVAHSLAGGKEWSSQDQSVKATTDETTPAVVPWQLTLPTEEGVYDVIVEAFDSAPLRIPRVKLIAERHIQLVVVADQPRGALPGGSAPWTVVTEIDPTNPHWYDKIKSWSVWPNWSQPAALGNGPLATAQHTLGPVAQIAANANPLAGAALPLGGMLTVATGVQDIHWQAYPLTINRIGAPHILELEYPGDVPQALGISIIEPNAAGMAWPIALDSGVFVEDDGVGGPPAWQKHRLLFWPRTKSPIVLLTNRASGAPAVYGKIRVLAGPSKLPRAFAKTDVAERFLAGYQSRPLLAENFGGAEALDPVSQRSLTDWQTFYDGASRLAEYLNYVGYAGHMLAVMADGSTIYPSKTVEPATRYDSGAYFESAADPVRKDALEMILRIFDREGLKLVPALQFVAPLPELEARLRRGGKDASGVQLIGPDGRAYCEVNPPGLGTSPYYNPLNENVQEAMLSVVRELVNRYQGHASFAGLAIELTAEGYGQLPGDLWGLDDETIGRFQRETGTQVPGSGEMRYRQRAEFLSPAADGGAKPQREAWLRWRANALAHFYREMQKELIRARPDAAFYLAATDLLHTEEAARFLRPSLTSAARVDEALLAMGIRGELLRDQRGLVVLRPQRIGAPRLPAAEAVDFEVNRGVDFDAEFRGTASDGAIFVHEPLKKRLESFEAKSPFGKEKTLTELVAELVPSDGRNRERFVHALAVSDREMMLDGGWLLPMGQEDSLMDLVAAYRRLPAGNYELHAPATPPVTIRILATRNNTYLYLVNDSAWPVTADLQLNLPPGSRMDELTGRRPLAPPVGERLSVPLRPFDLVAVRCWAPDVKIADVQLVFDDRLKAALDRRRAELLKRVAAVANAAPIRALNNPSFEQAPKAGQIPGWSISNAATGSVSLDAADPARNAAGKSSVRLESSGKGAALISDPFPAPITGRMSASFYLRVEDATNQPTVIVWVKSSSGGYRKFGVLGKGSDCQLAREWKPYSFPINDVPAEGVERLRLEFELIGAGRVWIDDVQVFDLQFSPQEVVQLRQIAAFAAEWFEKGDYGQCLQVLDGYWPRFLSAHVPVAQLQLANQPAKPPEKAASKPSAPLDKFREKIGW